MCPGDSAAEAGSANVGILKLISVEVFCRPLWSSLCGAGLFLALPPPDGLSGRCGGPLVEAGVPAAEPPLLILPVTASASLERGVDLRGYLGTIQAGSARSQKGSSSFGICL